MIPIVCVLPEGYDCTLDVPFANLEKRLAANDQMVIWRIRVYRNGEQLEEIETPIEVRDGRIVNTPAPYVIARSDGSWREDPRFFESDFITRDGEPGFHVNQSPPFYTLLTAPSRKSVFSDNAYKYSHPVTIMQIKAYGQYNDTYAPILIDRENDYGETIGMINPYNKTILARISASGARSIRRIRIPAHSALLIPLEQLLEEDEVRWHGRIQITANNRLVTFSLKHSVSDQSHLSDFEHLDPFRADPTHLPAFQKFRQGVGKFLQMRRTSGRNG